MALGSRPTSRSIMARLIPIAVKYSTAGSAASCCRSANRIATATNSTAVNSSTSGYRALIRTRQSAHRPRSTSQPSTGMLCRFPDPVAAGRAVRGRPQQRFVRRDPMDHHVQKRADRQAQQGDHDDQRRHARALPDAVSTHRRVRRTDGAPVIADQRWPSSGITSFTFHGAPVGSEQVGRRVARRPTRLFWTIDQQVTLLHSWAPNPAPVSSTWPPFALL